MNRRSMLSSADEPGTGQETHDANQTDGGGDGRGGVRVGRGEPWGRAADMDFLHQIFSRAEFQDVQPTAMPYFAAA